MKEVVALKFDTPTIFMLITVLLLILNMCMIFFYVRIKKIVNCLMYSNSPARDIQGLSQKCSELNERFEKVAMIRISELEDKISRLKELLMVSDERIVRLIDLQKTAEAIIGDANNLQKKMPSSGVTNEIDIFTKMRLNIRPEISAMEGRMMQKIKEEYAKIHEEMNLMFNSARVNSEPVPAPKITDTNAAQAAAAKASIIKLPVAGVQNIKPQAAPTVIVPVNKTINSSDSSNIVKTNFSEKPKVENSNSYMVPTENLASGTNNKYAEVYKLASDGLDAAEISERTKIEKRAINIILLGMREGNKKVN